MYNLNSYLDFVGKGNKGEACAAVPMSSAKRGALYTGWLLLIGTL